MTDEKQRKRIKVLLRWRDSAVSDGHTLPTADDIVRIAETGLVWPPEVDLLLAEPWRATIEFLLRQLKFGVHDPVPQLPDNLRVPSRAVAPTSGRSVSATPPTTTTSEGTPSPAPVSPAPVRGDEDPVFAELVRWRGHGQETNPSLQTLKDSQLRRIVNSNSRTADEIVRHLPPELRSFAAELVGVIAGCKTPPTTPTARPNRSLQADRVQGPDVSARTDNPRPTSRPPADEARRSVTPEGEQLDLSDVAPVGYHGRVPLPEDPKPIAKRMVGQNVQLSWDAYPGNAETVIYRVVSGYDYAPSDPQSAEEVALSTSTHCVYDRSFRAAVLYVQVWCHVGATIPEAAETEPVLHAETQIIAPVLDGRLVQQDGVVYGRWRVPPGVLGVQVRRIPADREREAGAGGVAYRLPGGGDFRRGFEDGDAEPGQRYVYRVQVEARIDGRSQLSESVRFPVEIPAKLSAVTDMGVTQFPDGGGFELSWTPPELGDVDIYMTKTPMVQGGALDPESLVVRHPRPQPDGRDAIRVGVLPSGWTRAYFTPFTVLGDQQVIGEPAPAQVMPTVRDAVIVERAVRQVLTFPWPSGVAEVDAYIGPARGIAGVDDNPDAIRDRILRAQRPEATISVVQHREQGGLHFPTPLRPEGCQVYVVPVLFDSGKRISGPPATLDYPGLRELRYRVTIDRERGGRPLKVTLALSSFLEPLTGIPFVLVYREDRFPLHARDGMPLTMEGTGDPGAIGGTHFQPSELRRNPGDAVWIAPAPAATGYLRLFVSPSAPDLDLWSVRDPGINELRLGSSG